MSQILFFAHYKINNAFDKNTLKHIKICLLGDKGILQKVLNVLFKYKNVENLDSKKMFLHFNKIKSIIKTFLIHKIKIIDDDINKINILKSKYIDFSLPGRTCNIGNLHPITFNINYIKHFFLSLGFKLVDGNEIEDCYHNFDALNINKDHPARSDKDSFWIKKNKFLLRTHTTCVQIRMMTNNIPPLRYISIGKVYRYDNDPTHTPMFHQIEGLVVDKKVYLCNLKEIIKNFLFYYFNNVNLKIRFRPSYFPFTEPSMEVDIFHSKDKKWLEILGCGLLHPNVFKNVKINPDKYNGLAFGIGIERLIMVKYNISDLRILYENNLRFLNKFKYIKNEN